jgi:GT2 family glycosyltransferase
MSATAAGPAFRPIKLATIDVERCPERITGGDAHDGLWALVREGGRPRGMIELAFEAADLDGERLQAAIAALPTSPTPPADTRVSASALPFISVVVPSMLERLDGLHACLRSLAALDYPRYEVIVVDNRPAGAEPAVLDGATVVRETHPGISAARNCGLRAARGEIIAFTDDDVVVDPGWLTAIAERLLAHPQEACVTGLTVPSELETPSQVALERYYGGFGLRSYEPISHRMRTGAETGGGLPLRPATVDAVGVDGQVRRSFSLYATGSFGHGANMAIRTAALRDLGGFDPALGAGTPTCGGEDLAIFARLIWRGHHIGFEPAAVVHHCHRREDRALRRQIEGYGIGWGATLLALIAEDPRHLGPMLATVPRGVSALAGGFWAKLRRREPEGPEQPETGTPVAPAGPEVATTAELARLELRGIALSPVRYVQSRRRERRCAV